MAQILRPTGKRRGRWEREGTGLRPDIADRRGRHNLAAFAGKESAVGALPRMSMRSRRIATSSGGIGTRRASVTARC
jgi:hypothetical protein